MAFIQLQIPNDAEVGDGLTFSINGKELEIPVPEGSVPGDVLQIQIDDDPTCKEQTENVCEEKHQDAMINSKVENKAESGIRDEKENGKDTTATIDTDDFKVPLHESLGITLEMKCSMKDSKNENNENARDDQTTPNKTNKEGHQKSYEHDLSRTRHPSDGTFAMAWPAGIHLSKCISSPSFHKFTKNKKAVVEIGSGLGLVGMSFMTTASYFLSHRKSDVKKIKLVLTDVPSALPIIRHNVEHNMEKLSGLSSADVMNGNIIVEPLVWGDQSQRCSLEGKVDLILASDLLYNATIQTYESLCRTVSSLLEVKDSETKSNHQIKDDTNGTESSSKCEILIAVRWRKPEEERYFFQLVESKLNFQFDLILDDIKDEAFQCDLNWKEFGNPRCRKSNEYFTNTFVEVQGEAIALKDVTETHMDSMTEDEYMKFEARYIQIYHGRKKSS